MSRPTPNLVPAPEMPTCRTSWTNLTDIGIFVDLTIDKPTGTIVKPTDTIDNMP